jgi:ABC-2 type transport system permease protein
MPLFFASNAIYPTDIMPGWLKTISHLNPLTYVVDALRTFMLAGSTSAFSLSCDHAVIGLFQGKNVGKMVVKLA